MKRVSLDWLTARPIAHRGYHDVGASRPENSLAAFAAAVERDYAIECDLHPSADGVPMVFHDDDLERLTGRSGCVRDFAKGELASLRLLGTAEPIPTLSDLLDVVGGRVPLVIELKHLDGRDEGFAAAVLQVLQNYSGPAALMSFDRALLADLRRTGARRPCGLTAEGNWRTASTHLAALLGLRLDFLSYAVDDLPTPLPALARRVLRIPVICWTVRNGEQLRRAGKWADQITFEGFPA